MLTLPMLNNRGELNRQLHEAEVSIGRSLTVDLNVALFERAARVRDGLKGTNSLSGGHERVLQKSN